MRSLNYRYRFLLRNLLKGLLALTAIVIAYVLLQKFTPFESFLAEIGKWPLVVYMVFILSEVVLGIIPPEFFMVWSIENGAFTSYALDVGLLAGISYLAGVLGYAIGTKIENINLLSNFFKRYIYRYRNMLNRYGGFLILVGAVTPVPFSATCILVGASNYNVSHFLLIASARLLRFAAYSAIIYQANI